MDTIKQDYIIAYSICHKFGWKRRITISRIIENLLVNIIYVPSIRPLFNNCGISRNYNEILEKNIRSITEHDIIEALENILK